MGATTLGEVIRLVVSQRAVFVLQVVLATAALAASALLLGFSRDNSKSTLDELESVENRTILVEAVGQDQALHPAFVQALATLPSIERSASGGRVVAGSSPSNPGRPAASFLSIGARSCVSHQIVAGRCPREGEAVLSEAGARSLGLEGGIGEVAIENERIAAVGTIRLDALDVAVGVGGLYVASEEETHRVALLVNDIGSLEDTVEGTQLLVGTANQQSIQIDSESNLEIVRSNLLARLHRTQAIVGWTSILLIAMVGLVGSTYTVVSTRRDIGRRRVLGAPRSVVAFYCILQSVVPTFVGALLGLGIASAVVYAKTTELPSIGWFAGSLMFVASASALGALVPAVLAPRIDPIRLLRVP